MHLLSAVALLTIAAAVAGAAEITIPPNIGGIDGTAPTVKLDKNLRRALLKALADLEAESAEQRKNESEENSEEPTATSEIDAAQPEIGKSNLNQNFSNVKTTTFSFNGFLGDGDVPSEEKLQNSSFAEVDKYAAYSSPTVQKPANELSSTTHQELKSSQVHDLVSAEKSSALYLKSPLLVSDDLGKDYQGTRSIKDAELSVNSVQSVSSKPITQLTETLSRSASNNIAAADNSLITPKPTASSLTVKSKSKNGSTTVLSKVEKTKEKSEVNQEVRIFQAPLVAAFTVQQDERGVPKSVVPIYRPNGDGQALTLQEQLEFKQKQLEQQLAELQRQQLQQTEFLNRQQQLYEEQLRFKQQQQQQIYLRERARLTQLEEQRLYQQRIQQQQQQQRLQQASFDQNSVLGLQSAFDKAVLQFEPSISLQLPNVANPPLFQNNYQDQLRLQQLQNQQQLQQQQQIRQQQQQQQQQQLQQQQQRLQQSFGSFPATEFQVPTVSASRFNRQELFGSTGNFGFNDNSNNGFNARGNFGNRQLNAPGARNNQNFGFDGFNQFRQNRPQTPAKQIQHLLYQSGVATDLGTSRGSGGAEDLNIVSKVLALNVGALPSNSLQFGASERVNSFAKSPNAA